MQMPLTLDACARCGQPILPGQPVKQTASVDFIGGRVVASTPRSWHLTGGCPDDADDRKPVHPTH